MIIIRKSRTVFLFHCCNLVQFLKKLFKSVSLRRSNLKFCAVTSTKDTQQIPKSQISVTESLMLIGYNFCAKIPIQFF